MNKDLRDYITEVYSQYDVGEEYRGYTWPEDEGNDDYIDEEDMEDNEQKIDPDAEREALVQDAIALAITHLQSQPSNSEAGLMAMTAAEKAADQVRHWVDLAKCWVKHFNDIDRSQECFNRAIDLTSGDVATVDYRIREVDDEGKVVRHVIGYRMVPTGVYLNTAMATIVDGWGDSDGSAELMAEAESKAAIHKSTMRGSSFQFTDDALQYFDRAETQLCWLWIARCWATELGRRDEALRCAAKAEEIAIEMSGSVTWIHVAKFWMNDMGQPEEGLRCVTEAENTITDPKAFDYMMLAEGVAAMGDPELPVRYLDKAESSIDELSDWSAIKYIWEELGYFDRAERADKIWEYLHDKADMEDYMVNGGYGRYVPGEGPY